MSILSHSFVTYFNSVPFQFMLRDLSEISRGDGHNFLTLRKGRGHEKWAVKRGRVMQIYTCYHVEVHPQKKKEVLYLVTKKKEEKSKNNGKFWI